MKQTTMEYPHASPVLPHTIFPKIDGYIYKKYTNIVQVYIISFNSLGKAINIKIRVSHSKIKNKYCPNRISFLYLKHFGKRLLVGYLLFCSFKSLA